MGKKRKLEQTYENVSNKKIAMELKLLGSVHEISNYERDQSGRRPALDIGTPTGQVMLDALDRMISSSVTIQEKD